MANPVTRRAVDCVECERLSARRTPTIEVLDRLPDALFNKRPPEAEVTDPLLAGDTLYEETVFGPLGSDDATPQWELARVFAREKDAFVAGWRLAESLQLGLGHLHVTDAGVAGEGVRASGVDLDRVGTQFGTGRPTGFTDCCYWRLIQVLVFSPGPSLWKLLEIAELFTGVRPVAVEAPATVTLIWPSTDSLGVSYAGVDEEGNGAQGGASYDAFASSDTEAPLDEANVAWGNGADPDDEGELEGWWESSTGAPPAGLTLEEALGLAKSAGVYLELQHRPPPGMTGCAGCTQRGAAEGAAYGGA